MRIRSAVSPLFNLGEQQYVSGKIFSPGTKPKAVLVCFAGGGCSSNYFDLCPANDVSYSFARSMVARGCTVILLDYLATGESSVPNDPMQLDISLLIDVNHAALKQAMDSLKNRGLHCPVIAVGHSMGAMLALQQQARHLMFDGMALLGYSNAGMPHFFESQELDVTIDNLHDLSLAAFSNTYQTLPMLALDGRASRVSKAALESLNSCQAPILPLPAVWSMIPNASAPQCASLDVPLLLINGDEDIAAYDAVAGRAFTRAPDITLLQLDKTRHLHFLYDSRMHMYDSLHQWILRLYV